MVLRITAAAKGAAGENQLVEFAFKMAFAGEPKKKLNCLAITYQNPIFLVNFSSSSDGSLFYGKAIYSAYA